MIVLAFDTCFNACSVAIGARTGGEVQLIAACFEPMSTGQAERLLPMVSQCLTKAKLSMADIGKVVVTTGPGTFTGTRIGISAAKGLALVHATPVAGLSSLHLMARQIAKSSPDKSFPQPCDIGIVVDVRRDEVYMQVFDRAGLNPASDPELLTVAQARALALSKNLVLAGSGASLVAQDRSRILGGEAADDLLPDAQYAIDVLLGHLSDRAASPLYLRAPDAKPSSAPALQRH